ncbi:MAG: thiolase domain-containing protein [Candidatus Levybacteria bacterium]|nr:thiolase domain-containing protein [Candidatus Levybacteria bacterium]
MKIGVIGYSTTEFGELWDRSPRDLSREVFLNSLKGARLEAAKIEALYVGNMLAGILGNQANLASFYAEELGIAVPSVRVEAACASGSVALHNAVQSVKAGLYKTVMVLGIEKMTDHTQDEVIAGLMAAGSDEERASGITFAGLYALIAQTYMKKYGISEEDLAEIPVKNHFHGSLNPKAQFRNLITVEQVMKSARISDPLKLLDCSPISDGASAVIISSDSKLLAKSKGVTIVASQLGTDSVGLCGREDLTTLKSAVSASKKAYAEASIKAHEVAVAEVHDCFSIAEAIALEDLSFSKKGMGVLDVKNGKVTLGSSGVIINPSGGLKACGHPVGATGIKQVIEIAMQLEGVAGKRQVKNATIGLTHNVGGSGAVAGVHILRI